MNCTNHVEIIDRCSSLATYSFTTSFNSFPKNDQEFRRSCDRIGDGLKCLKVQGKCLSSVARRTLQSFQNGRQRHSKKLCGNMDGESAKKFQQTFACLDKVSIMFPMFFSGKLHRKIDNLLINNAHRSLCPSSKISSRNQNTLKANERSYPLSR